MLIPRPSSRVYRRKAGERGGEAPLVKSVIGAATTTPEPVDHLGREKRRVPLTLSDPNGSPTSVTPLVKSETADLVTRTHPRCRVYRSSPARALCRSRDRRPDGRYRSIGGPSHCRSSGSLMPGWTPRVGSRGDESREPTDGRGTDVRRPPAHTPLVQSVSSSRYPPRFVPVQLLSGITSRSNGSLAPRP